MRSKLVLAALITLLTLPALAQVAPAVKISGFPLGVGGGLSDYDLDFGYGSRMIGLSAWADYKLFHGLGVEAEGTFIFADKPDRLIRMKQDSFKGGGIYKTRPFYGIHPYVKGLVGWGNIQFPSRNPLYTEATFTEVAMGVGAEYRIWKDLFERADYEYEMWESFQGPNALTPNGYTFGAMYYFRGVHRHY